MLKCVSLCVSLFFPVYVLTKGASFTTKKKQTKNQGTTAKLRLMERCGIKTATQLNHIAQTAKNQNWMKKIIKRLCM